LTQKKNQDVVTLWFLIDNMTTVKERLKVGAQATSMIGSTPEST